LRHNLLQYLKLLGNHIREDDRQPGDVAARSRQARHMSEAHGVGMPAEHDWDRLGHVPGGLHLSRRQCEDDVDIHADQLGRQLGQLFDRFRPAELDNDILAFNISELAQAGP
jgi:hypothetical protein